MLLNATWQKTSFSNWLQAIPYVNRTCARLPKPRHKATLPTLDALQLRPQLTRRRPEAYILADTCQAEVQKLRTLGIEVQQTKKPLTLTVQKYTVTQCDKSRQVWENIYPVTVSTELTFCRKTFPSGSFIIPLSQKNANLATSLLEPESTNGFVSFCVTATDKGKELSVYRKE